MDLSKNSIKILIATHKSYTMPADTDLYLPIHVGSLNKPSLGYQTDAQGDHIADLNPKYCELTGLYWAWKNLTCDYVGLVHYRRYFASHKKRSNSEESVDDLVLTRAELESALQEATIIVPRKRHYYIESLASHYGNTFTSEHIEAARAAIQELEPTYLATFDRVMARRWGYMFNMFIMPKDLLDAYCQWLFPILAAVDQKVDSQNYTAFEARYIGRVSELLFNVWLDQQDLKVKELPVVYLGKVDYVKKIKGFLMAKFFKKKYTQSF
ncbi:DUF4422 domain-containing protein [Vaginisenegalia massiliensis]|uniref:DUF4422 domain-containing protein n=1 Tax=Vaginisenegalia massiliensis TaxID=2058294 RepID=UPI0024067A66|nr:DUF4422 domain-containing protein [Vaginisenegalia massiliensis]